MSDNRVNAPVRPVKTPGTYPVFSCGSFSDLKANHRLRSKPTPTSGNPIWGRKPSVVGAFVELLSWEITL